VVNDSAGGTASHRPYEAEPDGDGEAPGAFPVMGDVQWLPGYCVLLVDHQGVGDLTDLDAEGGVVSIWPAWPHWVRPGSVRAELTDAEDRREDELSGSG
jgi:hypothetical protein